MNIDTSIVGYIAEIYRTSLLPFRRSRGKKVLSVKERSIEDVQSSSDQTFTCYGHGPLIWSSITALINA